MKSCKTCDTVVNNSKTYCGVCVEGRKRAARKAQTEERKGMTRDARRNEQKRKVPDMFLVRGLISNTSMRSNFG